MTMQDEFFGQDLFRELGTDFLEDPGFGHRAAFFSQQGRFGTSQGRQRFFENRFSQFQNQFLGKVGQQILSGEPPTLRFADFVQNIDFNQEFARVPPNLRGSFTSRFAPATRFINF
jgi:hypothetical protein